MPDAGATRPYGSPALRSTRVTRSRATTRKAKRHRGASRRGQGTNPTPRGASGVVIKSYGIQDAQEGSGSAAWGCMGAEPPARTARGYARMAGCWLLAPDQPAGLRCEGRLSRPPREPRVLVMSRAM